MDVIEFVFIYMRINLFIMCLGLENVLVSYVDDATFLVGIPSPNMRSDFTESLNPFASV